MPKVFMSYCWAFPDYKARIKEWADRLISDGIEVVVDIYDLREGDDKNTFMESMVTDSSVTHVLIFCNKIYKEKADQRKGGVGIESQIISEEVYQKVKQSKFIPIVCEFDDNGAAYVPTYLKSRIWIDFSSLEAINQNWERLIRLIYDKPEYKKPALGKTPRFISSDAIQPTSHINGKFNTLKQAILQGKRGLQAYENDFLDSCINYADDLRVRENPNVEDIAKKNLDDLQKLRDIRNHLTDWVIFVNDYYSPLELAEKIISLLERLLELRARPKEVTSWNEVWFEPQIIFVFETFLYFIAALMKMQCFEVLHDIFSNNYLIPFNERNNGNPFGNFDLFYGYCISLESILTPEGKKLFSPTGEYLKISADRRDLPFKSIIEADLLAFLISIIRHSERWFPQTFYYVSYGEDFPFFLRLSKHKQFEKFSIISEFPNAEQLKNKLNEEFTKQKINTWFPYNFHKSLYDVLNIENFDKF